MSDRLKVFVPRGDHDPAILKPLLERYDVEVYPGPGSCPRSEFLRRIKGKHGVMIIPSTEWIDREAVEAAGPQLKCVSCFSVGYDHVDISLMKELGIAVGNTRTPFINDGVAEFTICLTIMTLTKVPQIMRCIKADSWQLTKGSAFDPRAVGNSLFGKKVGLFGFGGIGQAVGARLVPFKVASIAYNSRTEKPDEAAKIGAKFVSFDELVRESDVVIITCSLNESTRHVFNAGVFARMKKTAFIINVSRGTVIQQDDLIQALKSGTIAAAGLDVMTPEPLPPDHELTTMANVTLTPHMATAQWEARMAMGMLAVENLIAGLEGKHMPSRVC